MIKEKACAIALLNRITNRRVISGKLNISLNIESQYTKSDFIFYKFEGTNIAVTKRLNHLDFSILEEEDWNYILANVTNEYAEENKEMIDDYAKAYSGYIHAWSEENSIISKIYNLMNNPELNGISIRKMKAQLEKSKDLLQLLMTNRATIRHRGYNYRNESQEEISAEVDISIAPQIINNRSFDTVRFNLVLEVTDHNFNMVRDSVLSRLGTGDEEDSPFVLNVSLLLGLLIIKYNRNQTDPGFISHRKNVYRLKQTNGIRATFEEGRFLDEYKNVLLASLSNNNYNSSTFISSILLNRTDYYNRRWSNLRGVVLPDIIELDIDYRAMTDEDLELFKTLSTWIINRHARYIGVNDKEQESYLLFLSRRILKGKKATRIALTDHLDLWALTTEIDRRREER